MIKDDENYYDQKNWVMGTGNDGFITRETNPIVTQEELGNVTNHFGQVKYAKREGAKSIYKDVTRNTANDNQASAKAEGSTVYEVEGENEESQGI